ncbi:Aste57867_8766 [Aphanomyces stellatus]|uniref:Structure-specific endonuclease subunit SLX1 homolog n=1 Tax=Aphanomyces stellatus TaxID=120398 RepID=A0A485KL32_9STRA|nr:hypothetical protein As57867_008732 [Aphanomyces stellatus]VFT85652.1 Aste57867_8766 [Aphanomyces stellatus]
MFFACYLLAPLDSKKRNRVSYIGFTVTPKRRIRQHNGELVQGAKKTLKHRPWEMILVVYGFPTKELALQFEWVWQHPYKSRFTKPTMGVLKTDASLGGMRSMKRKIRELHLILNLPPWSGLNMTVSYTSPSTFEMGHSLDAFPLPPHMQLVVTTLDDLPASHATDDVDDDNGQVCHECGESLPTDAPVLRCYAGECSMRAHVACLSKRFTADGSPIPEKGNCGVCAVELTWPELLTRAKKPQETSSWAKKRQRKRRHVDTRQESSEGTSRRVQSEESSPRAEEAKVATCISLLDSSLDDMSQSENHAASWFIDVLSSDDDEGHGAGHAENATIDLTDDQV